METTSPPAPSRPPTDLRDIQLSVRGLAVLQVLLLVGLLVLFFQINGVPDLTAQRVPRSDFSGSQADSAVGPMGTDINNLRTTVDAMSAQIDAICAAVADKVPAAVSPNPCNDVTPTRAP